MAALGRSSLTAFAYRMKRGDEESSRRSTRWARGGCDDIEPLVSAEPA
jgi:hypothetical protein